VSPGLIDSTIIHSGSPTFDVGPTPNPSFSPGASPQPYAVITPSPYDGSYSALTFLGGDVAHTYGVNMTSTKGANGICQTFVVPTNGTLSLYVNEGGDEGFGSGDQEATLFIGGVSALASPSPIPVFQDDTTQTAQASPGPYTAGTWSIRGPYTLSSLNSGLTPGTTVTLFLGSYTYSTSTYKYSMYMFVDDVSVFGIPYTGMSVKRKIPAKSTTPLMQQRTRTH
jgi:hypothetical protein